MKILTTQNTILTSSPADSSTLDGKEIIELPAGKELEVTGKVGNKYEIVAYVWKEAAAIASPQTLDEGDYQRVAKAMDCDVAAVKAVVEIESRGSGFLLDGRPRILFEAHWFGKLTDYKWNATHPNISRRGWDRSLYGQGGAHQWERLEKAIALDRNAALQSASWGLGQVMGFNHGICGYPDAESFVEAMSESEGNQLDAMFAFIKSKGLDKHLRAGDWAKFAYGYNGSGYRQNQYDTKLEAAYNRHA